MSPLHTAPTPPLPGRRRALARAAFAPFEPRPTVTYRYDGRWLASPPTVWAAPPPTHRLAVVVPTLTHGRAPRRLHDGLARIAEAADVLHVDAAVRCLVAVVVFDTGPPSGARDVAVDVEGWWRASGATPPLVVVTVSAPSKILALNAALPLLDANAVTAVSWFDDDVEVARDCLLALWRAFDPTGRRVYGARVEPTIDRRQGSLRTALARRGAGGNAYPYGCGMLTSRATFGDGVPLRYMSDDHFFLFALLDPSLDDPLERLPVVSDAVVRVSPPAGLRHAVTRVVRNYRNVQRVLADTDAASTRWFRRELHFPALRPPRGRAEATEIAYWARLAFDGARGVLWGALVIEVLTRGALRRPRPSVWSSVGPR